jgi:hypothetical protein
VTAIPPTKPGPGTAAHPWAPNDVPSAVSPDSRWWRWHSYAREGRRQGLWTADGTSDPHERWRQHHCSADGKWLLRRRRLPSGGGVGRRAAASMCRPPGGWRSDDGKGCTPPAWCLPDTAAGGRLTAPGNAVAPNTSTQTGPSRRSPENMASAAPLRLGLSKRLGASRVGRWTTTRRHRGSPFRLMGVDLGPALAKAPKRDA